MDQRLASLEQNVQQPRLAMEVDVPSDETTRERTEAPVKQFMRCMGISVLQKGSKTAQRSRPLSA